ncbi:MAG: hypothetical protein ACI9XO_000777 [Paraglaciecola sp.]|jgi:hypothetical protein
MNLFKTLFALFLFSSLSFVACNLDGAQEAETTQLLQGRWDLLEAYRNGKKTETLTGTFFEFTPENKLTYNLAGSREAVTYELDGQTLTPIDSRQKVTFAIEELDGEKLTLSMMMRNTPFKFILTKTQ